MVLRRDRYDVLHKIPNGGLDIALANIRDRGERAASLHELRIVSRQQPVPQHACEGPDRAHAGTLVEKLGEKAAVGLEAGHPDRKTVGVVPEQLDSRERLQIKVSDLAMTGELIANPTSSDPGKDNLRDSDYGHDVTSAARAINLRTPHSLCRCTNSQSQAAGKPLDGP
jgi:hypothetical protein